MEHRDSLGNGAVLTPGNLQYMSAGTGIRHSEFNPSKTEKTHLYQIWLLPKQDGGEPRYEEKPLAELAKPNGLTLLYSGDGREGSTQIRQDAEIYFAQTDSSAAEEPTVLTIPASDSMPHAWIQVISGEVSVLGETLSSADGLAIEHAPQGFEVSTSAESRFLIFRLS